MSLSINDVRFKRAGVWRWFGKGGYGGEESEEEELKLSGFLALECTVRVWAKIACRPEGLVFLQENP